jgi:alpha-L-fucosidase
MNKIRFCYCVLALISVTRVSGQPLAPCGPIPSKSQLEWHRMEYYMFIHFGPNTFTNKEWGHGDEDPRIFQPSNLDCRQWARTAKAAGMKGIIITAKHHDGFCLWPSQYSKHTVRESLWRSGQGDVLKELSAACKAEGLRFGVYLSPWDRNHPDYGTDHYNGTFMKMLSEVLGNYGEVFEQWFDGANGEGPNGKKQVYNWNQFDSTVYHWQPQAIIFSDGGPGCRWVGNENGEAGETNWCLLNASEVYPGYPEAKRLTPGDENGHDWVPAECDVSIRPGWFYSPETDDKIKSVKQLMDIYYNSVGRGANLLLNVPVDRRGLISSADSVRLMEFRAERQMTFQDNLCRFARAAGQSRKGYSVGNIIDDDESTGWATSESLKTPEVIIKFKGPVKFNCVVLSELIALGQRVKSFTIEVGDGKSFKEIARQTTIGHKRIVRFAPVEESQIRIRILESKSVPVLSEVQIYNSQN